MLDIRPFPIEEFLIQITCSESIVLSFKPISEVGSVFGESGKWSLRIKMGYFRIEENLSDLDYQTYHVEPSNELELVVKLF